MFIDASRVAIKEKDIEDFLWEHPSSVNKSNIVVDRWVGRQFDVPGGIIDLLGVTDDNSFVVVEVKNVPIDASALTQVSRYAYDITQIADAIYSEKDGEMTAPPRVHKIVVGRSIDSKTMYEAKALGIHVIEFDVRVYLCINTSYVNWTDNFIFERSNKLQKLRHDENLVSVVSAHHESFWGDSHDGESDVEGESEVESDEV